MNTVHFIYTNNKINIPFKNKINIKFYTISRVLKYSIK